MQCGNNKTTCPDAPIRADSDLELFPISWFGKFANSVKEVLDVFLNNFGKIAVMFWVVLVLFGLGILKVIHIIMTGNIKISAVNHLVNRIKECLHHIMNEWCPVVCAECWTGVGKCCSFCRRKCCFGLGEDNEKDIPGKKQMDRGWRPPPQCNGMCKGAKYKRRTHRRIMRINRRTGGKGDVPWFHCEYTCTCKVKEQMPLIKICAGLFFFFYCPFLPVWWILEFIYQFLRKKRMRRMKKQRMVRERALREAKQEKAFVHLDKYSRGQEKSDVTKLDREMKKLRQIEKKVSKLKKNKQ